MQLCVECLRKMPRIACFGQDANPTMRRLEGRLTCSKATSLLEFVRGNIAQQIVYGIKYERNKALGVWCGRLMYQEMSPSGFFEGIDLLVPVPLHKKKKRKRGFNQSEAIAEGLSNESGIPVDTAHLVKIKHTSSQTRKDRHERWQNSRNAYALSRPEDFAGKHLLLIDDVVTTGSTLEAVVDALSVCEGLKISVLTLAVSR